MTKRAHHRNASAKTGQTPGSFGWKLILIAGSLLILSQTLGTFVSLLTFESNLLNTLTAKYDILGKDLKRKIERSLKFGKTIDRFVGLEALCRPLFQQARDINEILITDGRGKIFFSSRRPDSGELAATPGDQLPFQPADLLQRQESVATMRSDGGKYYFLTGIKPDYSGQKGVLAIVISRAVLDRSTNSLIRETAGTLGLSLLLTLTAMAVGIHFFFTRPSRKQADALVRQFKSRRDASPGSTPTDTDDTRHIYSRMLAFRDVARKAEQDLKGALDRRHDPEGRDPMPAAVLEIQNLLEENPHEKQ